MVRLPAILTLLAVGIASVTASAQVHPDDHRHGGFGHRYDHDYWHRDLHTPDIVKLDEYSDRLAKIARHLHADAHKLSQDYQHSESIEYYVDQIDRLQQHLHELLHRAVESGRRSAAMTQHAKRDVSQVKSWLNRLYGELQHQGYDGARTTDYHAMVHMRRIIINDAMPLVRLMETELYGYSDRDHWHHGDRWNRVGNNWSGGDSWNSSRSIRIPINARLSLGRIFE